VAPPLRVKMVTSGKPGSGRKNSIPLLSVSRRHTITRFMCCLMTGCALGLCGVAGADESKPPAARGRSFQTSFESIAEFKNFYIVPQNYKRGASHDLAHEQVRSGTYAHKGWIYARNRAPNIFTGDNNHRAYPTIQLHKLPGGGFRTPCLIDFWVWLDAPLSKPGEWFSFATLSADASDRWRRVVLLNVGYEGWVHLMHVPNNGERGWEYQNRKHRFPMREWVHLKVYLDFDAKHGIAKAWMNGELVSQARVRGGKGVLQQAHFGLYAPPNLNRAVIYNDDLTIHESVPHQELEVSSGSLQ
jgi:hypothetical protein